VTEAISWLKLPIIGMSGAECGRTVKPSGDIVEQTDFQWVYGRCDEPARWLAGTLLLCQRHAEIVAAEVFGDDIAAIEAAWREACL
jgi:hypothetical protein